MGSPGERVAAGDDRGPGGGGVPRRGEDLALRMPRQVDERDARRLARPHEIGQEPDRVARSDETDVRHQVGRLEPHVGLEAGVSAELNGPLARRRSLRLEHPRHLGCRREESATRSGGYRVGWQREADRVRGEVHAVELLAVRARVTRVLLGDHEVEVAGRDLEEPDVGLALRDLDPEVGMLGAKERERLRHHRVRRRLEDRDAHRAADGGERARDIRLRLLEPVEHRARVADEEFGLRGQLHATADLHEQRHPGLAFELAELLRDR